MNQGKFTHWTFFCPFGSANWDVKPENLIQVSANFNWHDSQDQVFFPSFRSAPMRPGIRTAAVPVVSGSVSRSHVLRHVFIFPQLFFFFFQTVAFKRIPSLCEHGPTVQLFCSKCTDLNGHKPIIRPTMRTLCKANEPKHALLAGVDLPVHTDSVLQDK